MESQRIIKFRGRCVITGNWAYGYFYISKGNYIIRNENDCETIVMPNSVSQYSCLSDKNGKDIYESDIYEGIKGDYYQVFFLNGAFCGGKTIDKCAPFGWELEYENDEYTGESEPSYFNNFIAVVGNIFDNVKLLE